MTATDLAKLLQAELKRRNWAVSRLAREAHVAPETVRRAVQGIGSTSLDTANNLLAILDLDLVVEGTGEAP